MQRKYTRRVIFHHSLSTHNDPIAEIERWHRERGIVPVGYHYYIRTDGAIEAGRYRGEVGAHAKGKNFDSVGVCLAGDFRTENPTPKQIAAAKELYVCLCATYGQLAIDFHRELDDNPCPGPMLQRQGFADGLTQAWEEVKSMANLDKFRTQLTTLLEREDVSKIKDETVKGILNAAGAALQPYDPRKNVAAGNKAAVDSLIAVTAAAAAVGIVKGSTQIDQTTENMIAGLVGLVVSMIAGYVRGRLRNYRKHK